jgi:hypothetical protein
MAAGGWPETESEFRQSGAPRILSPDNLRSHFQKQKAAGSSRFREACCPMLPADSQFIDNRAVALDIFFLQVIQKSPSLTDDLKQPPSGMMVLFVGPKMLGEILNALGKKRDLHFGGPGVAFVGLELIDDLLFTFCGQHLATSFQLIFCWEIPGFSPF